jgi:NitT/TauT family transport system ATP-binding protein
LKNIKLRNISKNFSDENGKSTNILNNICLDINNNQIFIILGSSGCGKTTLLRILANLDKEYDGSVSLNDEPLNHSELKIGFVFQKYSLFPWLTVFNNIAFGLNLKKFDKKTITKKVEAYVQLVELNGFENYYPYQISEGMKQRVAIARALVLEPEALLMDEPFGSLDVKTSWKMQQLVRDISIKTKIPIVFVTHNVEEGVFLGDKICILTPRPAKVAKIIDSPFPKERLESIKLTEQFLQLETEINKLLRDMVS